MLFKYAFIIFINLFRYFLLAGIPFLIIYILYPQYFQLGKLQKHWAKRKDFLREVFYSLQTNIIIAAIALLFIHSPLSAYTQLYRDLHSFPIWWIPVSILLALILHDTYFYWLHRSIHQPLFYRKVHLVHHKSVNPSPWASYSFHLFEGILEAMIAPLILLLIPIHPLSLIIFTFIAFAINVYGHLGYEIAPKWFRKSWLFEIINTSVHHNLHHEKINGNYGLYFRIWDRLMKTESADYVERYDAIQAKRFGEPVKASVDLSR